MIHFEGNFWSNYFNDLNFEIILKNLLRVFVYDKENPMLFNSGAFLFIFTIFIAIYLFIYKSRTMRTVYILLFSLFFYYKSSGGYLVVLLFSIVLDYFAALGISKLQDDGRKGLAKILLIISIVVNVGLLFYFKYTNLLLGTFYEIINPGEKFEALKIFLPIGVSFYTFQTLSYVIDVYKKVITPTRNLIDYAFYMSFFPHLVAGPIVRARDFLPQITEKININRERIGKGLYLICKGLVKKAIIADYIAIYCDLVYTSPETYGGFESLMAVYGYTLQIYCDFSGYSDIAIGLALIMGYTLTENFNLPYKSTNITEFWRRWHISLSSWLKDYIYIPLGGNRKGEFRTYLHLFATMLIGGFWHGANWKFVLWGAMHGIGLAIHKIYLTFIAKHLKISFIPKVVSNILSGLITFHFVAFLWIFFRATSFESAMVTINKIMYDFDISYLQPFIDTRTLYVVILVIGYLSHYIPEKIKLEAPGLFTRLHPLGKAMVMVIVIQIIVQLSSANVQPFIYFQF